MKALISVQVLIRRLTTRLGQQSGLCLARCNAERHKGFGSGDSSQSYKSQILLFYIGVFHLQSEPFVSPKTNTVYNSGYGNYMAHSDYIAGLLELKSIERRNRDISNAPEVKRLFELYGIQGQEYGCNTCLHKFSESCQGIDLICKDWFWPNCSMLADICRPGLFDVKRTKNQRQTRKKQSLHYHEQELADNSYKMASNNRTIKITPLKDS